MNRQLFFIVVVQGKNLKVPISDGRTIAVFGFIRSYIVAKSNGLKDEKGVLHDEKRWIIFNGKNLMVDAKTPSVVVFDGVLDRITILSSSGEIEKMYDVDGYGVLTVSDKREVTKEYVVDEKGRLKRVS